MSDLITNARARIGLPNAGGTALDGSADDLAISTYITAASSMIEKWCRRSFGSSSYDELYNGTGNRLLLLRNFPIISVASVRYRQVSVVQVSNTSQSNQKARVSVTPTGVTLVRIASGSTTTDTTSLFGTYTTMGTLVSHINGIGGGWSARVAPGYENWPSTDLYIPIQGAQNAAGVWCDLRTHADELIGFQIDASRGALSRSIVVSDPDFILPEDPIWPHGILNFRVQYQAGYATVPLDVQEACAQMVASLFLMGPRQGLAMSGKQIFNPIIKQLLMPYRSITVDKFGG